MLGLWGMMVFVLSLVKSTFISSCNIPSALPSIMLSNIQLPVVDLAFIYFRLAFWNKLVITIILGAFLKDTKQQVKKKNAQEVNGQQTEISNQSN